MTHLKKFYITAFFIFLVIGTLGLTVQYGWWNFSTDLIIKPLFQTSLQLYVFIGLIVAASFFCAPLKFIQICIPISLGILFYISVQGFAPVVTVTFLWGTAYLIGLFSCELLKIKVHNSIEYCALGLMFLSVAIGIASHFALNYSFVYLAIMCALNIGIYKKFKNYIIFKFRCFRVTPLQLFFVIFVIILLLLISLAPDTGHDSLSTHLTIPRYIYENRVWNYDVNKYIWAVAPMGANMLFVPAYMFGSEEAIKLLNISFILASAFFIFESTKSSFRSISIGLIFALAYLTLPVTFYVLGQAFIEPALGFFVTAMFVQLLDRKTNWYFVAFMLSCAISIKPTAILFVPILLALYFLVADKQQKYSRLLKIILITLLFGFGSYVYAYLSTGNPLFPQMNEIFKSELMSKEAFYNPTWANSDGIAIAWKVIFESKKYGEFLEDGVFGIFFAVVLPFSLALSFLNIKHSRELIYLLCAVILFATLIFWYQGYIRYVYPIIPILFILCGLAIARANVSLKLIVVFMYFVIGTNIIKATSIAYAFQVTDFRSYLTRSERALNTSKIKPFSVVGEFIRINPEMMGKRVLLLGYGVDPIYYHFPKETVAYSWHSRDVFNQINSDNGDITKTLSLNHIDLIVCPAEEHVDDKFHFSIQCKEKSDQLLLFNGVYLGKVHPILR